MKIEGRDTLTETSGLDEWELDVLSGDLDYEPSDPKTWPSEIKTAARNAWRGGPEAFDRWVASQ